MPWSRPREVGVALLLFSALTIIFTWPVTVRIGEAVPFYNDTWIFVWNVHHVRAALLDPTKSVYETSEVFHPDGISLAYHTMAPLYGALAVPLEQPLGLVVTYNLFVLLTFVTSAMAAWWLARGIVGDAGAALIAGCLYAFSPFHQVHMPHLNLLSLQFLPLVALAAHAFLRSAGWSAGLALAVLGALSFYACHEYALFAALLALLLAAWGGVRGAAGGLELAPTRDLAVRGAGVAAIAIGLAAPGLIPMLAEAAIESHYSEPVDVAFSADLLSWITPSVLHSLWGGYTMKIYQHFPGVLAEWTTFIGITVAALCLLALVRARRPGIGFWVVVAGVFGTLAMGPCVRVLGESTSIPLPYALLKSLPVMSAMREPSRFAAGVTLATSVLASLGFVALRSRFGRKAWLVLPLALVEFIQAPVPMSSTQTPAFLSELRAHSDDFAVLEVPSGLEFREHLYHQAIHGKRIFLGYIARIPEANRRFIATEPLLVDPALWPSTPAHVSRLARSVDRLDVRYALIYEDLYLRHKQPERFAQAVDSLMRLPGAWIAAREDGFVAVELRTAPPRPDPTLGVELDPP